MISKTSKAIHVILWVAQIALAILLIWAGLMKLFHPIQKLSVMWPWTGQVPIALVKFTGIVDLLAAIGLTVPSLIRYKPGVTSITAIAIIVLMVCAAIFHIARRETPGISVNIVVAIIAAFIAWGRFMKEAKETRSN